MVTCEAWNPSSCAETSIINQPVLITGGTGFLGGHLAQTLSVQTEVRVIVRDFSRAARLARFPVKLISGDITSLQQFSDAAAGCGVIFHCAYGNSGDQEYRSKTTVGGTANAVEAAITHGCKLIHVSSVAVYGSDRQGHLDENSTAARLSDTYSQEKTEAERLVANAIRTRGLQAVILQPTIIYGPFSPYWTQWLFSKLQDGPVAIPSETSICNCVYVGDVVSGMISAARRREANGEKYLLSGEPATWASYLQHYGSLLGHQGYKVCSLLEIEEKIQPRPAPSLIRILWNTVNRDQQLRVALAGTREAYWLRKYFPWFIKLLRQRLRAKRALLQTQGEKPEIGPCWYPDRALLAELSSRSVVSTNKAHMQLQWAPIHTLDHGMKKTLSWLRWVNNLI